MLVDTSVINHPPTIKLSVIVDVLERKGEGERKKEIERERGGGKTRESRMFPLLYY